MRCIRLFLKRYICSHPIYHFQTLFKFYHTNIKAQNRKFQRIYPNFPKYKPRIFNKNDFNHSLVKNSKVPVKFLYAFLYTFWRPVRTESPGMALLDNDENMEPLETAYLLLEREFIRQVVLIADLYEFLLYALADRNSLILPVEPCLVSYLTRRVYPLLARSDC